MDLENIRLNKPIKELLRFSIINIDKPTGPTSFAVSQYVRRALKLTKTSHMGTLDPQVTGVLPVALDRACRLSSYLMHRDKTYVGIMRLHTKVSQERLKEVIAEFTGKISQLPPVRSRVKREVREREVKSFDILEIEGTDVLFRTKVQAGTYIRKLVSDMGDKLGGAHMLELRRTEAGLFTEDKLYKLYDFDKAVEALKAGDEKPLRNMLVPGEIVASLISNISIKKDQVARILRGSPIFKRDLAGKVSLDREEKVAVFSGDKFIGCYRIVNEGDVVCVPEFVFN